MVSLTHCHPIRIFPRIFSRKSMQINNPKNITFFSLYSFTPRAELKGKSESRIEKTTLAILIQALGTNETKEKKTFAKKTYEK